jgi:hypothetical protein
MGGTGEGRRQVGAAFGERFRADCGQTMPADVVRIFYVRLCKLKALPQNVLKYSHEPHKDVSVNDVQHIRWWSHNIVIQGDKKSLCT